MQKSESLDILISLSREFGSDSRYVIAGGGNSSLKENGIMYVKGSGSRMGTITGDGFAAMSLDRISSIWEKTYSDNTDKREEEVLADLLSARLAGEENKRPSVETLLHSLFPEKLVMHTHPALVNGITCSVNGEKEIASLFGNEALWIPLVEPGYILAKAVREAMEKDGGPRNIVFLQNHGVFISADSPEEIRALYKKVFLYIEKKLQFIPKFGTFPLDIDAAAARYVALIESIKKAFSGIASFTPEVISFMDIGLSDYLKDNQSFSVLEQPLTPDHIVYAGFLPLFIERSDELSEVLKVYYKKNNELPKIIALKNSCCFACAPGLVASQDARDLFLDVARVIACTRSFGGPLAMTDRLVTFIRTWEAEKYRQKKA